MANPRLFPAQRSEMRHSEAQPSRTGSKPLIRKTCLLNLTRILKGSIGGLGSRMEKVLGTSRDAPLFELRDLKYRATPNIASFVKDADAKLTQLHQKYRQAPMSGNQGIGEGTVEFYILSHPKYMPAHPSPSPRGRAQRKTWQGGGDDLGANNTYLKTQTYFLFYLGNHAIWQLLVFNMF